MPRLTFEGKRYPILDGEDALQALVRGGADVRFSCRKGTCQSCLLRADEGDPGAASRARLRPELAARGYFLPCLAHPTTDVVASQPDRSELSVRMHVHAKERLAPDIWRLLLEPETTFTWRPGQFVNVRHPSGAVRSYSVASLPLEDYFVELHVARRPDGLVSQWLCDEVAPGDVLDVQGPQGACVWDPADADRTLLLLGTGTGLGPLLGILREAVNAGHRGDAWIFHGVRESASLHLDAALRTLVETHPWVRYVPCVSRGATPPGGFEGRVTDAARGSFVRLDGATVFLAGDPSMVDDARYWAFACGVPRERIHADPFEPSSPFLPDDGAKLAAIAPDPELWEALGRGRLLRAILTDFYERVYADPRLAPFFHKVTIERAIDKQYAFLADVFAGRHEYFGLKPFNAHHWMVISDELFDYRERLIEECMRRAGVSDEMIRRWGAVHERFRREIVKASPRGLVVDGVEREVEREVDEVLAIPCVCDGCTSEMPAGSRGRLNSRTGALFCASCAARRVGETLAPPA